MWPFSTIARLRKQNLKLIAETKELEEALRQSMARENSSNFISVKKDFNSSAVDKLARASFDQVVDKYEGILHRSILDALQRASREWDTRDFNQPLGMASVAFERQQSYYQMIIHIPDYHHTVKIHRSIFDD